MSRTASSSPAAARMAMSWMRVSMRLERGRGADGRRVAGLGDGAAAGQADAKGEQHLDYVVGGLPGAPQRRHPAAALAHVHRGLAHAQAVVVEHEDRLDLGEVVRVVAREDADRAAVVEAET